MTQIWAAYGFMFAMIGLLYVLAARNRAEAAGELVAVFSAEKGYVDPDSVVTLFDAGGHFLQLPAKRWEKALGSAMAHGWRPAGAAPPPRHWGDRKSTRLNSSHANISYAVFCLKKKNK